VKTITNQVRRRWRGQPLPPLVESINPFLESREYDLLLRHNLCSDDVQAEAVLLAIMQVVPAESICLYYPIEDEEYCAVGRTFAEITDFFLEDGFAQSVYILDTFNKFFVYSNSQDSFSIWIIQKGIIDSSIKSRWDAEFQEHLSTIGVGFGEEGRAYITALLREVISFDVELHRRFSHLIT
jgi:hypothetical protein